MSEPFKAHVQYDDLYGTAAADHLDQDQIEAKLIKAGLMTDDDEIVGIELFGNQTPGLKFLIIGAADRASLEGDESIPVRVVEITGITFDKFFFLFKRFMMTLVPKHRVLTQRRYVETSRSTAPSSVL